jgi:hypothetical protein
MRSTKTTFSTKKLFTLAFGVATGSQAVTSKI